MAKRSIGIDLAPGVLRVAIITMEKGRPQGLETARRPCSDPGEIPGLLREVLGGDPGFGDRLAMTVPARETFIRDLTFPFADGKKIAATLPLELATQLPLSIEECAIAALPPRPAGDQRFTVTAAAVRAALAHQRLDACDQASLPIHVLDLAPYALAAGLREAAPDGLQVCVTEQEATVTLVQSGAVRAYRVLPLAGNLPLQALAPMIAREATTLGRTHGQAGDAVLLTGPGAAPALDEALAAAGLKPVRVDLTVGGQAVASEFQPAAAYALRAAGGTWDSGLNFRQGVFTLRSEWARLRGRLMTAAALLLAACLAFGVSAWLGYASKAQRAEALNKEMVRIYRSAFPGATAIIDVPMQMKSKIKELQTKTALVAGNGRFSPLAVLQNISELTPKDLTVDVRDLSYTPDGVRLEGTTTTFEATNRLAKSLEASPLFKNAQISDAKMSLDGKTVDFRLNLQRRETEVTP